MSSPFSRLVKNALYNSGGWGISLLITLLATPYYVYKLTPEGFGVFILITSLIGYYNLLDLGLGQGVTKYVAEYKTTESHAAINDVVNGALWLQFVLGLMGSVALITFAGGILSLLHVSEVYWNDAIIGIYAGAIGFFFTMLTSTLSAVLMGLQRYDITSLMNVIINSTVTVVSVGLLYSGGSLKDVIFVSAAGGVLGFLVHLILVKKFLSGWFLTPKVSWKRFKSLMSFSFYVFISRVSNLFSIYIVRFIVGFYLGPVAVTYYVVPTRLLRGIGSILYSLFAVLFPYASELDAQKDDSGIRQSYLLGSRIFASLSLPAYCLIVVFAKPILTLWMGADFSEGTWMVMRLLALSALLGSLSTVPNLMTNGLGRVRITGFFAVITTIFYIILLPLFTSRWEIMGTAFAMLTATIPGLVGVGYQIRNVAKLRISLYLETMFLNWHVGFIILISIIILLISWTTDFSVALVLFLISITALIYLYLFYRSHVDLWNKLTKSVSKGG